MSAKKNATVEIHLSKGIEIMASQTYSDELQSTEEKGFTSALNNLDGIES